jgi:secreted Zn-dependent insulinase-like peptidase
MLFMGSGKFPGISEYTDFLQKNGGSRNAATGEDFTFFYFDVQNDKLDNALDRFSDFFKDPLFTIVATDTEIN